MVIRKIKNKILLILGTSSLLLQGCSSMGKSVGLGSVIGAGSGAVIGGIKTKNGDYRTRNVIIGAGIGSVIGGVTGAVLHESNQRDKEMAYMKGRESKDSKSKPVPDLQQPEVEAQWVESKVIGNRYIEGHYEYIITEPTRWKSP